jgi:hypothetical protein
MRSALHAVLRDCRGFGGLVGVSSSKRCCQSDDAYLVYRLVEPQTAASYTLPASAAWALAGPDLVRTKGARRKTAMWEFPTNINNCLQVSHT